MTFPLKDFSVVFKKFIKPDGTVSPSISFAGIGDFLFFSEDPDGLIATMRVHSFEDDEPCLLTALFPMSQAASRKACKSKRFPVKPKDIVSVKRLIDEVTGRSGETYSRFQVEVTRFGGEVWGNETRKFA